MTDVSLRRRRIMAELEKLGRAVPVSLMTMIWPSSPRMRQSSRCWLTF